jgi:spermidine synthase
MKKLLISLVFVVGYLILSLEILGGRLLAPFFGNSIYVWGSLIGVILVALSGGYYLGGWLSEFYRDRGKAKNIFSFLDKLFFFVVIFLLFDLFFYLSILNWLSSWDLIWGSLLAVLILFCLPMVALAATSPLVIKILSEQGAAGYSAGLVYTWGTLGSILGTFLTTFYLIPYFGSRLTLYSCFFIALLILIGLLLSINRRVAISGVIIFLISLAVLPAPILSRNVILETESAYNQIRVINKEGKILLTLNSQRDLLAQSGYSVSTSSSSWSYINNLFGVGPFVEPVNNLLILGMAAGSTVLQHRVFSPQIKIDAVEIDPKIIAIAKDKFGLREDENLKIFQADARPFLSGSRKQYDMIEIDLFWGSPYIPFYVATQEFFGLTAERLSPNGIMMMNIFAPGSQEILEPILNTIASVYPSVYKIPYHGNFIVLATRSETSLEKIKERLKEAEIAASAELRTAINYGLDYMEKYLPNKKAPIFTDDWAPTEIITYKMLRGFKI